MGRGHNNPALPPQTALFLLPTVNQSLVVVMLPANQTVRWAHSTQWRCDWDWGPTVSRLAREY